MSISVNLLDLQACISALENANTKLSESWPSKITLNDILYLQKRIQMLLDEQLDDYFKNECNFWDKATACQNLKIRVALDDYRKHRLQLQELLDEQLEDYFASVTPHKSIWDASVDNRWWVPERPPYVWENCDSPYERQRKITYTPNPPTPDWKSVSQPPLRFWDKKEACEVMKKLNFDLI
jgi:hypothetical protein